MKTTVLFRMIVLVAMVFALEIPANTIATKTIILNNTVVFIIVYFLFVQHSVFLFFCLLDGSSVSNGCNILNFFSFFFVVRLRL